MATAKDDILLGYNMLFSEGMNLWCGRGYKGYKVFWGVCGMTLLLAIGGGIKWVGMCLPKTLILVA